MKNELDPGIIIVVGLGEIGKPLFELLTERYETAGVDIDPIEISRECEVMHICFPYLIDDFVEECARYIRKYQPKLTVINSTVAPGTTRKVAKRTGSALVYSPVRGKHIKMKQELIHYTKYIGGMDKDSGQKAAEHFQKTGMKTRVLSSPEAAELAKLTETTYFGLLIAWAQEIERYCDQLELEYEEIIPFFEEISYLPPVNFFPGVIGGHCVMPNIEILNNFFKSDLLIAVEKSNQLKKTREEICE